MPKAAKAKTAKSAAKASSKPNGLTPNQYRILAALRDTSISGKTKSRPQIMQEIGITKGYAKLMGAPSYPGYGAYDDRSSTALEPRGLVKSFETEGERALQYAITAAGRKALEKHEAQVAKENEAKAANANAAKSKPASASKGKAQRSKPKTAAKKKSAGKAKAKAGKQTAVPASE